MSETTILGKQDNVCIWVRYIFLYAARTTLVPGNLKPDRDTIIIIITTILFQEDNIFGTNASLTYGPQLQYL